jgi:hypothetical protein
LFRLLRFDRRHEAGRVLSFYRHGAWQIRQLGSLRLIDGRGRGYRGLDIRAGRQIGRIGVRRQQLDPDLDGRRTELVIRSGDDKRERQRNATEVDRDGSQCGDRPH